MTDIIKEQQTIRKDVKRMGNEVGIIGQMYEHRTNHKIGVLESRDKKFKTLLMRDKEGNSFNINVSTFKSSWRKYAGSEIIETSTQKEEKKSQKKEQADKAKKVVEKTSKQPQMSQQDKVKIVHAYRDMVNNALAENNESELEPKITYKGAIKMRYRRKVFLEIWRVTNGIDVYVTDELANMIEVSDDITVKVKPEWTLHTRYSVAQDKAEMLIQIVVKALSMYAAADREAKKKEEE